MGYQCMLTFKLLLKCFLNRKATQKKKKKEKLRHIRPKMHMLKDYKHAKKCG